MKTFYILNSFLSPHAFTHLFFAQKLANGFSYDGFDTKTISSISEIKEDGFVLVSDSAFFHSLGQRNISGKYPTYLFPALVEKLDKGRRLRSLSLRMQIKFEMKKIAEYAKSNRKKIILIVWGRPEDYSYFKELGLPFIMTGEYADKRPVDKHRCEWYDFWNKHREALPIKFCADVDPAKIGLGCKNTKYAISFIGSKNYNTEYYSMFQGRRDCAIIPTPPFISEEKITEVYKNSRSNLGLQGNDIIKDNMVTDRIFEALAYGAISLTNSPVAVDFTQNLAILIKDKEHLKWLVDDIKENRDNYMSRREKGFKYIKSGGTYAHEAKKFVGLAKKLYGIDFG